MLIFKYPLKFADKQVLRLPKGAMILSVVEQNESICVYAKVDNHEKGVIFKDMTVDEFLELAEGKYPNGSPQEGIVIRSMNETYSNTLKGRLSFKVISNTFLLKEKD